MQLGYFQVIAEPVFGPIKEARGLRRFHLRGQAKRGDEGSFGDYGLQVTSPGWITARQIESVRIALTRFIKKGGKLWIRIFPDKSVTARPPETRSRA